VALMIFEPNVCRDFFLIKEVGQKVVAT